jgi:hypothetical protein
MTDIIIFRMKKYTYSSTELKLNISSLTNLKTILLNQNHINSQDLVIFIYAGKVLSDSVDISTIIHPLCVYILTDIIKTENNVMYNMLPDLFSFLDSVNRPAIPMEPLTSLLSQPLPAILREPITYISPVLPRVPAPLPQLVFPYQRELDRMLEMGFTNESIIRNSLIMTDGNIEEAITVYINFG